MYIIRAKADCQAASHAVQRDGAWIGQPPARLSPQIGAIPRVSIALRGSLCPTVTGGDNQSFIMNLRDFAERRQRRSPGGVLRGQLCDDIWMFGRQVASFALGLRPLHEPFRGLDAGRVDRLR